MNQLPDMFYVKAEHKENFLNEKVSEAKLEWSGQYEWKKFPAFLNYRKCDYSGETFQPDDQVFCVYVMKLK
jgi:hypothetical protein